MNLDLLTLLENIVSGFVSFFYSLARSLFATARRPIRGPVRLYRKYKSHAVRQIGGVTFLCMGFFISFYVLHHANLDVGVGSLGEWLRGLLVDAVKRLPDTRAKDLWPVFVASLISTIVIDAAFRLYLDLRHVPHKRRDMALGSAEFALFWAAPFAVVFALLFLIGATVDVGIALGVTALTMVPILMVLCIPAAAILRAGTRKRTGSAPATAPTAPRHRRWPKWLAVQAAVALVVLTAATAGAKMWILIDNVQM